MTDARARTQVGRRALLAGLGGAAIAAAARAQNPAPVSAGPPAPGLIEDLVAANRILADQGVVDGFGHVSVRHNLRPDRFLLARSMAPALVTAQDIMEFDLDGTPVDPRGRSPYLERFIHSEILRARPDVNAVVHSHAPSLIAFGVVATPLRPLYHMSGFLGAGAPVFEIRDAAGPDTDMLIRSPALGRALAKSLGAGAVVLMRGHGAAMVGASVRLAVMHAIYAQVNAQAEAEALRLGPVTYLNPAEAARTAAQNDALVDRPWAIWKAKAMGPGA